MHSEMIKPKKKVRGGVAVSHEKHTKDMPVKRLPAPETVTLPMRQHIGAPCTPTVKVGDTVLYSKYAGSEFKIDGEEVVIVSQSDILAIVE